MRPEVKTNPPYVEIAVFALDIARLRDIAHFYMVYEECHTDLSTQIFAMQLKDAMNEVLQSNKED